MNQNFWSICESDHSRELASIHRRYRNKMQNSSPWKPHIIKVKWDSFQAEFKLILNDIKINSGGREKRKPGDNGILMVCPRTLARHPNRCPVWNVAIWVICQCNVELIGANHAQTSFIVISSLAYRLANGAARNTSLESHTWLTELCTRRGSNE